MKKSRLILIILSVLILLGCIGMTAFLLFFNYQNVRLFKQAQSNFLRGDDSSLLLAESQLQQVVQNDNDNEAAFIMLGEISRKKKIYPEQVYYCYMAYRLNPLSSENKSRYIDSLCFARYFDRLESFLSQENSSPDGHKELLYYAACRNGNVNKYKHQMQKSCKTGGIRELTSILFEQKLSDKEQLAAVSKLDAGSNAFLAQEIWVAKTDINLSLQNIDAAEESLLQAYKLNEYAFAPALGRFYAGYRNFGKALEVLEKHLSVYHDQSAAMQCAEIYCLLAQADKIAGLRKDYQSDSGSRAMLCDYYFESLISFLKKDFSALKEITVPLRKNINTPLAAFMFFCVDVQQGDVRAVQDSYNALLAHRSYLDLQEQADNILLDFLKKSFANRRDQDKLVSLASQLYGRKKNVFLAKLILLAQKRNRSENPVILADAVKRFSNDRGVIKLAIEYYLSSEQSEAEKLIGLYKKKFPAESRDMLRYEIILNMRKRNFNKVSELFQKNFSPEFLPEYWAFASSTKRKSDLQFLSKDKLYGPYCRALLLLKDGESKQAVSILETADAQKDPSLLFFAAKILAENGAHHAALKKYGEIPDKSPLQLTILLNTAEIHAELGDIAQALILANRAYTMAPQMPETQLCYADKLHKNGKLAIIPDVIKLSSRTTLRRKMQSLWVLGMQQRIKECNINTQQEKIRELCRQLLVISPDNNTALEYLKKLHQMPQ